MTNSANCLVVAGPSGVGKSTLIHRALSMKPNWEFSVSVTTRPIRDGEAEGKQYYFVSRERFEADLNAGRFLEYAEVYGNLYGTPVSELERARRSSKCLLIEIDTVGCLTIRAIRPEIPLLAILPPSIEVLKERLRDRNTEDETALNRRFVEITAELQRMRAFDFAVINDDIETAAGQLIDIMTVVEQNLHLAQELTDSIFPATKEHTNA